MCGRAGGNGTLWVVLWVALCAVHAYAALADGSDWLVQLLQGEPLSPSKGGGSGRDVEGTRPVVRSALFHLVLGGLLPVAIGTLPFVLAPTK